ncbi:uncharacterized protein [Antedon mediterranea]|uniref:uncharacterized protein n=1 Tax=Antedon mediterranea TaxID=105859 RepID=UPI003AF4513E
MDTEIVDSGNINVPRPENINDIVDLAVFKNKGLHLIHLNARFLLPKLSELKLITVNTKADVICVTETWLHTSITDDEIKMNGYSSVRCDRKSDAHGGTLIYIKDSLAFNEVPVTAISNLESVWIDILLPKSKPILIGCVYRPPNQHCFIEDFNTLIGGNEKETIILGDFNINILDRKNPLTKQYEELLNNHGMDQIIKEPSRITSTSSTLIDHILCNNKHTITHSGILKYGLSDHFITFCIRKKSHAKLNEHKYAEFRSLKNYTPELLNFTLSENIDWSNVYNSNEVNSAFNNFHQYLITTLIDKIAPMKRIRIKSRTEEWMTGDILSLLREPDRLLKRFTNNKTHLDIYEDYVKIRNLVQTSIKNTKADFIKNKILENKAKPKELWRTLKHLSYSNKNISDAKIVLKNGDSTIKGIATEFNRFFTHVAQDLRNKLPQQSNQSTRF